MTDMIWQLPKAKQKPRRHLGCCSANYDPIVLFSFREDAFEGLPFSTTMIISHSYILVCLPAMFVSWEWTNKTVIQKAIRLLSFPQIWVRHKLAERYSPSTLHEALPITYLQATDHYWLFNIEFLKEYLVLLILNLNQMESDLFNIPSEAIEHHFEPRHLVKTWFVSLAQERLLQN